MRCKSRRECTGLLSSFLKEWAFWVRAFLYPLISPLLCSCTFHHLWMLFWHPMWINHSSRMLMTLRRRSEYFTRAPCCCVLYSRRRVARLLDFFLLFSRPDAINYSIVLDTCFVFSHILRYDYRWTWILYVKKQEKQRKTLSYARLVQTGAASRTLHFRHVFWLAVSSSRPFDRHRSTLFETTLDAKFVNPAVVSFVTRIVFTVYDEDNCAPRCLLPKITAESRLK